MSRRSVLVAACATFILGVWTRIVPMWWSPLPATLDGFTYARAASDILEAGVLPLDGFRADAFGSTLLTTIGASVTGVDPVYLLQPLYATIGATTVLFGFVFARRLGYARGWTGSERRQVAILAAFGLAVEGIFVRRSGVPDDDTIALLLIPLAAFTAFYFTRTGRRSWYLATVPILIMLPLTHTFSTLMLALVLLAVFAARIVDRGFRRRDAVAFATLGGFWAYFIGYYTWAEQLSQLTVPYVGRITAHPGLFLAWLIVLVVGIMWFQRTSSRAKRLAVGGPLVVFLTLVFVNARLAVFPGYSETPTAMLVVAAALGVPLLLAAWEAPIFGKRTTIGVVLLALFAAPAVQVGFALTASLTPDFAGTAVRAQTHFHVPILVAAASIVILRKDTIGGILPSLRRVLAAVLVVALLVTLPGAYLNADTGSYPSTTLESEFETAEFTAAHVSGPWGGEQPQRYVTSDYFGGTGGSVGPIRQWLRGDPQPACPTVVQRSWMTTGAHLFPAAPATLSEAEYDNWRESHSIVYATTGHDPLVLGVEAGNTQQEC